MERNHYKRTRQKSLSTVILTWNSEKYIERCVRSVFEDAANSMLNVEVYAVDNASKDKTLEILDRLQGMYPTLRVIKLDRNYGTTVSRNTALEKCSGEYVLIIDSDTEIKSGALAELINTFSKKEQIGIVAPRLLNPDGSAQSSFKKIPTATVKLLKGLPIKKLNDIGTRLELYDEKFYKEGFKDFFEPDYCISACWMVNRNAINEVGLFDEHVFYAPEDVDYCLRMWLKGWHVVYNPKAEVVHYAQRVSHKSFRMTLLHTEGLVYYFLKYRYLFSLNKIYGKIKR